jgi:hypothetical protein
MIPLLVLDFNERLGSGIQSNNDEDGSQCWFLRPLQQTRNPSETVKPAKLRQSSKPSGARSRTTGPPFYCSQKPASATAQVSLDSRLWWTTVPLQSILYYLLIAAADDCVLMFLILPYCILCMICLLITNPSTILVISSLLFGDPVTQLKIFFGPKFAKAKTFLVTFDSSNISRHTHVACG